MSVKKKRRAAKRSKNPPSLRTAGRWFTNLSRLWKIVVGIVPVIGTLITTSLLVYPSLKPIEPSKEAGATLSNLEVTPNVTLQEYIDDYPSPTGVVAQRKKDQRSRSSKEDLERSGNIIHFSIDLKGLAEKDCYVRWSIYDVSTYKPVDKALTDQPAWPNDWITPHHQDSTARYETWVPSPLNSTDDFLVRLEAYNTTNQDEVLLDTQQVVVKRRD